MGRVKHPRLVKLLSGLTSDHRLISLHHTNRVRFFIGARSAIVFSLVQIAGQAIN